jgi:hypothetical protein
MRRTETSRTKMLNRDSDDKKSAARLEQVIAAIENKNKEALQAMFSQQALEEAGDFNAGMDYLFDFFKGKNVSWKSNGLIVDESSDYGHKTKEVKSFYHVDTDQQKYLFFLLEYTADTDQQDHVGLYTLRVIKTADQESQFGFWQDMKKAGIYEANK